MFWYLKNSIILTIVLIVCYTILGYFESPSFNVLLSIIYSFFLGAIPNSVFLSIICLVNKEYKIFFTIPLMILEVILLYLIGLIIEKTINIIPENYRFETTSSYTSIRSWFAFPCVVLYQYLILFYVLYVFKNYYLKKKRTYQKAEFKNYVQKTKDFVRYLCR